MQQIQLVQTAGNHPVKNVELVESGLYMRDGKIWISGSAINLVMRILIAAHCGPRAHRGADAMYAIVDAEFAVDDLRAHVDKFVSGCLLCKHVKGGMLIQRPWNVTHTATERNELRHMDFLYMGENYSKGKYILVLKDDLSHYCELVCCESANGQVAATAVLDWYKRFGLPKTWVSDNGSHFRNTLMEDRRSRLGATQRFVPVYTPWLNGTVERVNRDIFQVVRVLLLEYQLDTRNWEYLLPVIQANLNQTPVKSLAGKAPVEVFTGLEREPVVGVIVIQIGSKDPTRVAIQDVEKYASDLDALRQSLMALHQDVVDEKERRRLIQSASKKGQMCTFTVGDFVLWSRADPRMQGGKLMVRWVGPFQIVKELPTSFLIKHLLTEETFDVHAIRLKNYADDVLQVTEELKHHVSLQGLNLGVRAVKGGRYNRSAKEWELLVGWIELEVSEDSWEAMEGIVDAAPEVVETFMGTREDMRLTRYYNGKFRSEDA